MSESSIQMKQEQDHWVGWLKKRIELTPTQEEYVRFALSELQQEVTEMKALKNGYYTAQLDKIHALTHEVRRLEIENAMLYKEVERLTKQPASPTSPKIN